MADEVMYPTAEDIKALSELNPKGYRQMQLPQRDEQPSEPVINPLVKPR